MNKATFQGRRDEQRRFIDVLEALGSGARGDDPASWVVLVTGQGGIGKSRLLERFTERPAPSRDRGCRAHRRRH